MPTITTGGVAQQALPARPQRRGYRLHNLSAGSLWRRTNGTAAATEPSFEIPAGAMYETAPHEVGSGVVQGEISIFGATTGQAFAVEEW